MPRNLKAVLHRTLIYVVVILQFLTPTYPTLVLAANQPNGDTSTGEPSPYRSLPSVTPTDPSPPLSAWEAVPSVPGHTSPYLQTPQIPNSRFT